MVKLWDMRTGSPILIDSVLHPDVVYGVSFSPDGTELATACACGYFHVPFAENSAFQTCGFDAQAVFCSVLLSFSLQVLRA
jgi:WD40 repeat protein